MCEIPQSGIPPIIQTDGPIDIEYFESGGDVILSCPFIEKSSAGISLSVLKDGKTVDLLNYAFRLKNLLTFEQDKKFILRDGSKSDEGIYQCQVKNELGSVESYDLTVQMAYIKDVTDPSVEEIVFDKDTLGSRQISCTIESNPPAIINWKKLNSNEDRVEITDENIIVSINGSL